MEIIRELSDVANSAPKEELFLMAERDGISNERCTIYLIDFKKSGRIEETHEGKLRLTYQ